MQESKYMKEGQVQGSVILIITLIVGVGVSVMVLIFVGALGGRVYEISEADIDAIGYQNMSSDSLTVLNGTAVALSHSPIHPTGFQLSNNTDLINAANYSVDYGAGTLTFSGDLIYNNTACTANYSYGNFTISNHIKEGVIGGFDAIEQTGSYLPIIVLAVVISLVLMLVLSFGGLGKGTAGGGSAL